MKIILFIMIPLSFALQVNAGSKDCLVSGSAAVLAGEYLYSTALPISFPITEEQSKEDCFRRALSEAKKYKLMYRGSEEGPMNCIYEKNDPDFISVHHFSWAYGGNIFGTEAEGSVSRYTDKYITGPVTGHHSYFADGTLFNFKAILAFIKDQK